VPGLFAVGAETHILLYGFPRVTLSFFMGVVLLRFYREGKLPWLRMKWSGIILLIASFTLLPPKSPAAAYFDPLAIFLLYPAIILSTARWQPKMLWPAQLSGALSYPIYILHEPVLKLISAVLIMTHLSMGDPGPIQGAARVIGVLIISWICMKLYDEPLRRWLKKRFGSHPNMPIAHDTSGMSLHQAPHIDHEIRQ
jgi:peptidoglycan/LPS O-acetylase OafA/YrhL